MVSIRNLHVSRLVRTIKAVKSLSPRWLARNGLQRNRLQTLLQVVLGPSTREQARVSQLEELNSKYIRAIGNLNNDGYQDRGPQHRRS